MVGDAFSQGRHVSVGHHKDIRTARRESCGHVDGVTAGHGRTYSCTSKAIRAGCPRSRSKDAPDMTCGVVVATLRTACLNWEAGCGPA